MSAGGINTFILNIQVCYGSVTGPRGSEGADGKVFLCEVASAFVSLHLRELLKTEGWCPRRRRTKMNKNTALIHRFSPGQEMNTVSHERMGWRWDWRIRRSFFIRMGSCQIWRALWMSVDCLNVISNRIKWQSLYTKRKN